MNWTYNWIEIIEINKDKLTHETQVNWEKAREGQSEEVKAKHDTWEENNKVKLEITKTKTWTLTKCYVSPENRTWRTSRRLETNKALHKPQQGESKLVPQCLKGGGGNKPHSRPLILSKWETKQQTLDPETKGEVGVSDQGKLNVQKLAQRKKSQTLNSDFHPNRNTESRLMVSTPWRHTSTWAGELQPSDKVSQLTDCSQLRENSTGEPSRSWLPETWIWRTPVHTRTLENLRSVRNTR